MRTKILVVINLLLIVSMQASGQVASTQDIEAGNFVIIRSVLPEEALVPKFKLSFGKSAILTQITEIAAVNSQVRVSKGPASQRLMPGTYRVNAHCVGFDGKESWVEREVVATQRGYEYLVECLPVTGMVDTLLAIKQLPRTGDIASEINEARLKVIGRWQIRIDHPDATSSGELTIKEIKGEMLGKLVTATRSGNVRVTVQRRGIRFETRWTVAGRHEHAHFIGEFAAGGLVGEAIGIKWRSSWTATKVQ